MTAVTEPEGAPATPPDSHDERAPRRGLGRWWWAVGLVIAAAVVIILAPLASPNPDGLERVAEDAGFIDRAQNFFSGLLGDYAIPGIDDPTVSTIASGLLGVAIVLTVVYVLGRIVARRRA